MHALEQYGDVPLVQNAALGAFNQARADVRLSA
jgi:hypothetical protein